MVTAALGQQMGHADSTQHILMLITHMIWQLTAHDTCTWMHVTALQQHALLLHKRTLIHATAIATRLNITSVNSSTSPVIAVMAYAMYAQFCLLVAVGSWLEGS